MTNTDRDALPFPCHECKLWFSGEVQLKEHLQGRRHLNRKRKLDEEGEGRGKEEEEGLRICSGTPKQAEEASTPHEVITVRTTRTWLKVHGARARKIWKSLGAPKYIMAPMVKQSDLPFRILCRRYKVGLCYGPMIRARRFADARDEATRSHILRLIEYVQSEEGDRKSPTSTGSNSVDRPLVLQFCATDPESFCAAAKLVQDKCDAVDLNLGCPQHSARYAGFGAFMMDKPGLVSAIVRKASKELKVPVWCKIRMLPTREATVKFARMLEASGCSLLAIHARQRERSHHSGSADWDVVRDLKKALLIPVVANGNVQCLEDAKACLEHTGADGVMSAQGLLANPRLFTGFGCPSDHKKELQETKRSEAPLRGSKGEAHCWGRKAVPSGESVEGVPLRNRCSGGCLLSTKDRIEFCKEYISVFKRFPDRMVYLGDHVVSFFRADPRLQGRKEKENVDLYSLLCNPKKTTDPDQALEILHCWEHRLGLCTC